MLLVLSDTHSRDGPRLEGRTEAALGSADCVVHAGDFMTADVLDTFEEGCDLRGVYGNNDPQSVRNRLPEQRTVEWAGLRITVVHGHEHTDTALSMLARQSGSDLLVFGHSHRPEFREGIVPMLNPGSHAEPRWNRPAHAELEWDSDIGTARGRLVEPSGEVFERFTVSPREP